LIRYKSNKNKAIKTRYIRIKGFEPTIPKQILFNGGMFKV